MNSTITRNCLKPDCRVAVSSQHLVCVAHWQALTPLVRRDVQERLNGWKNRDAAREYLANHYRSEKDVTA